MLRLVLIRHGQSYMNQDMTIICGKSSNTKLTALGEQQAKLLGLHFKKQRITFDKVYSSTAVRAKETAKLCLAVMGSAVPVTEHIELEEIDQGEWELKSRSHCYTPEVMAALKQDNYHFKAPGGESQYDVETRMVNFITTNILSPFTAENVDRRVAIFGHGLAIKLFFRCALQSATFPVFLHALDNTGVIELVYNPIHNSWCLQKYNDTSHLVSEMEKEI